MARKTPLYTVIEYPWREPFGRKGSLGELRRGTMPLQVTHTNKTPDGKLFCHWMRTYGMDSICLESESPIPPFPYVEVGTYCHVCTSKEGVAHGCPCPIRTGTI